MLKLCSGCLSNGKDYVSSIYRKLNLSSLNASSLLKILEKNHIVTSEIRIDYKKKRYYKLTKLGEELAEHFKKINQLMK